MLHLAWRNLWRNGRRTAIAVAAIAVTTGVSVVTYGLMDGWMAKMRSDATRLLSGDAQVHVHGYRQNRSIHHSLPDPAAIIDAARAHGIAAVPRSYGHGLLAFGPKSAGALFCGVDPTAEREAFDLAKRVAVGDDRVGQTHFGDWDLHRL